MKLWQKDYPLDKKIESFTVGKDRELDIYLAEFDVLGSLAHTRMLQTIGLLTWDELQLLQQALKQIYHDIKAGNFIIEPDVEDVHSQVELLLTRRLGEAGKKIHSGRSRNDQVLVDLKLFMRSQIQKTVELSGSLCNVLLDLSNRYKDVLLPGYTHLQIAMPSSFGLWFGAYAESLLDDLQFMLAAYKVVNKNPLGSGAGYGSSFPLNRTLTTQLLGFETMHFNVVYAQMSRGKTEQLVCTALASLAGTVGRMAMDICLYNSQNFGFITLPDSLTTGSSIMPHKKNPDVAELLRGRCNRLKSLPNELNLLLTNLPSGYHRDLQLTKEIIMPAFEEILSCMEIAQYMLEHIQVKENILADEKYAYLFSVERVNELVLQGIPFREAYQQVGKEIASGTYTSSMQIHHTHEGSIGNLCHEQIKALMQQVLAGFAFDVPEKALGDLLR